MLVFEQYCTFGGMTISEELAAPTSDVHASGYLVAKLSPAPASSGWPITGSS